MKKPNAILEICFFILILILSFVIKNYFWNYGYSQGEHGLFIHGDGYFHNAKCFVSESCKLNTDSFRIMQFIYPLYLTPIFYFDLDSSLYVFILHHSLSALTLFFIFLSGRILHSTYLGLISSFVYACQLQIAYWFNFTLSDIAFHTHLSLFMLFFILLMKFDKKKYLVFSALSSLSLYFIRPEGILVFIFFIVFYFLFYFSKKFSIRYLYTLIISGLIISICSFFLFLKTDSYIKDKILSNTHVGWGLYYGSQETKQSADEVNEMLYEMFDTCNALSKNDPDKKNEWWWCSKIGLERILNNPSNYLLNVIKRIPSVLYPAFYRDGVSIKYITISSFFMTYILIGLILFLKLNKTNRFQALGLFTSVMPIYLIVIFYMDEWDVRYQLSPQVILILLSSYGYLNLVEKYILNRK